jgi:cytochrome c peroxidase
MKHALLFLLPMLGVGTARDVDPARLSGFQPLPAAMESAGNPITEAKVQLGRMLYYEKRLSRNGDVSCNSCHLLNKFGVDGDRFSTGDKGQKGGRNAPTVYNAAGHMAQFWDGRAVDVEAQAKGPVLNPVEMAMPNDKAVVAVLKGIPEYNTLFKRAFPKQADPVTFDNMALAIGAFERKLVTPSRWDKFLKGDKSALSADEKEGFMRFTDAGCQACHNGPYLGGRNYQKFGLVKPFADGDKGRIEVTKQPADNKVFKVPSLRNIEKTGPYFHNGSSASLDAAVSLMAEHQLGRKLTADDVRLITAWLKSLTGEIPVEYVKEPILPKGRQ